MVPVSVRYLLDRIRYPRSRANELAQLRVRFAQLSGASQQEREIALQMTSLKQEISGLLKNSKSCSACNWHHPRPEGPWHGGYCCSAPTTNLFTDDEIAALVASGVELNNLQPPDEAQHGCVFRGSTGCTIPSGSRPSICVRYLCVTLELELARSRELELIEILGMQLKEKFERFVSLRNARLEEEYFSQIIKE
jgi:hypothetical protein